MPKKFALLIGLDYPGTDNQLSGCCEDAERIRNFLKESLKFKDTEIVLLIDKDLRSGGPVDYSKRVDKARILQELAKVTEETHDGDFVFLHYSGHGTQVKCTEGDEEDGKDEAIYVGGHNNELIIDDEFRKYFTEKLRPGVKSFTLMDCCHSGSIFDLKYTIKPKDKQHTYRAFDFLKKTKISDHESDYNYMCEGDYPETRADVIMLSGCRDNETSLECSGKGVLTTAFIETVKANTKIGRFDLIRGIRTYIMKNKMSDQKPMFSSGKETNLDLLAIGL